jgi:hypothetical protein
MLEENKEIEDELLEVPTDHNHPWSDDNIEPQVEARDVPLVSAEEELESDNSMDGDEEDPEPPSEAEEVISRWTLIGGAIRMAQNKDRGRWETTRFPVRCRESKSMCHDV